MLVARGPSRRAPAFRRGPVRARRALYHANLLPLLGAFATRNDVGIVSVLLPLGSLDQLLLDDSVPITLPQCTVHKRARARALPWNRRLADSLTLSP